MFAHLRTRSHVAICRVVLAFAAILEVVVLTSSLSHAWINAPVMELALLTLWGMGSMLRSAAPGRVGT